MNDVKEVRKNQQKYEDMEADKKAFDIKRSAQKIVGKTHRALPKPFVIQPRDEKLIEEDSYGNNRNIENGGFNEEFSNNLKLDDPLRKNRSKADLVHVESIRPAQPNQIKRNIPQKDTIPNLSNHIPLSNRSTPNIDVVVKDNRSNIYKPPFQHQVDNPPEENYFSGRKPINNSLTTVDTRKMPKKGDILSFHRIIYKVETKQYLCSTPAQKTILDDVSGIMLPGVNAVMGPTGCGKSSLLDILAGRKDPQFLSGKVLINGQRQPKNFKCMSGYVVQDDIVMGTLTVRENLMFSAALRLPIHYTEMERNEKIDKIIDELGLTAVASSKIGTELIRGVSGGERKRCNIGMELITDPVVLFLDEPTTGLDAFTATSVIRTLQKLSRRGKTIILSIHQPKYLIYKLFDRYTLMGKGKILYHGRAGSAPIQYFQNMGYFIEAHNNPADFYIDIIHGEVSNEKEVVDQQTVYSKRYKYREFDSSGEYSDVRNLGRHKSDVIDKKRILNKLVNEWNISPNNKELFRQLKVYDIYNEDSLESSIKGDSPSIHYATNWFNQTKWVCWRTGLNLLRNPQTSVIQLGVYMFFALSMGIVYFGLTTNSNRGYQDRYGLFFFSALQVMFVNLGAIEIFIKERPIFIHENSSGYYRVSSYFIAKLLCDMVPIKVFPAIAFLPITYFMAKLKTDAGAFFFFELILLLTTSAGCSIAFFVSSSFSVFGLANVVTSIIYVFMMVFSGYLISIDSIFVWLNWCRYLSAFRYAIAGLTVNELNGQKFCQNASGLCMSANDFLDQNSIPNKTSWDLWLNPFGLFIITLVFLALCYIQLRRMNKYK